VVAPRREVVHRRRFDLVHHLHRSVQRWGEPREQSVDAVRGHANDGVLTSAQPKLTTDDGRVAAERRHPVAVSEDDHRMGALSNVVLRPKQSSQDGRHTGQREIVAVDQLAGECLDVVAEVTSERGELGDSDLREDAARLFPQILDVGV
jgi:hypothetical protein